MKTCYERVELKDGRIALCLCTYETMSCGGVRITCIVREVGSSNLYRY